MVWNGVVILVSVPPSQRAREGFEGWRSAGKDDKTSLTHNAQAVE